VRLILAQFIKPYRKSNKNDFIDGEAIAEAVTKENMRFVLIKTQEQLDVEAMHRVRDRLTATDIYAYRETAANAGPGGRAESQLGPW
jgi:transposase